jgi:protoporphyrinogen oxidase
MENIDNLVLGGGPAGIGTLSALGRSALLLEASDCLGGLCSSFQIDGFTFDHAVHLSFTSNPIVLDYLKNIPLIKHAPESFNYCDGQWVRYPVQNNLYVLPEQEKQAIIQGFKDRQSNSSPANYAEWLIASYGEYFAKKYPFRYTLKYWCLSAESLSTSWCGNRMYLPTVKEVEYSATHQSTPNVYYAKEMRYPVSGGYAAFFGRTSFPAQVRFNKKVVQIDPSLKIVTCEDGSVYHYQKLFSSLPLDQTADLYKDCPTDVIQASKRLVATSMADVSIGFKRKANIPSIWFYIYDESVPFARAYSPSLKAPSNAPEGRSSLQFEHYYIKKDSLSDDQLIGAVTDFIKASGIADPSDILFAKVDRRKYANVVFYLGMEKDRKIVQDYLRSCGIEFIGRFGQWDYLWSDQSFFSGFESTKSS